MHIPDGLLDPKISTGLIGVAVAAFGYSLSKVKETVTALAPAEAFATAGNAVGNLAGSMRRVLTGNGKTTLYKMGLVAALIFIAQMLDFPVGGGTSGHLTGGVFAAVLLGPFAGAIVMAAVLAVQALFLADGGVIALGANIVNMALGGTILAYFLYSYLKKNAPEWLAVMAASWASVLLASLACALELAYSGIFTLNEVVPAMVRVHAVVGIAEALITMALIKLFQIFILERGAI